MPLPFSPISASFHPRFPFAPLILPRLKEAPFTRCNINNRLTKTFSAKLGPHWQTRDWLNEWGGLTSLEKNLDLFSRVAGDDDALYLDKAH